MDVEPRHRRGEGAPQVVHRPVLLAGLAHLLDVILRRTDDVALLRVGVAKHEVVDLLLEPSLQNHAHQRRHREDVILAVLGVAERDVAFFEIHIGRPAQRGRFDRAATHQQREQDVVADDRLQRLAGLPPLHEAGLGGVEEAAAAVHPAPPPRGLENGNRIDEAGARQPVLADGVVVGGLQVLEVLVGRARDRLEGTARAPALGKHARDQVKARQHVVLRDLPVGPLEPVRQLDVQDFDLLLRASVRLGLERLACQYAEVLLGGVDALLGVGPVRNLVPVFVEQFFKRGVAGSVVALLVGVFPVEQLGLHLQGVLAGLIDGHGAVLADLALEHPPAHAHLQIEHLLGHGDAQTETGQFVIHVEELVATNSGGEGLHEGLRELGHLLDSSRLHVARSRLHIGYKRATTRSQPFQVQQTSAC